MPLHTDRFRRTTPAVIGVLMADKRRGLTYAESGVDIDAGNRMVGALEYACESVLLLGTVRAADGAGQVSYRGHLDLAG